ncbi:MAG: hypothetical protein EXR71_14055 [Myxococcales bacterium]|nr:hypothetical protein [Myxococcales bacterium]
MMVFLILACSTSTELVSLHCELPAPLFAPASGASGTEVVATTGPLTELWDTSVRVGSTAATVSAVTRATCDECDSCRASAECTSCDACTDCIVDCSACVETVTFVVPDVAVGPAAVTISNIHGSSARVDFQVSEADTADTGDSGDI